MDPSTLYALRKLIKPVAIGSIGGCGIAQLGHLLPKPWDTVWGVAFPLGLTITVLWISRDMRRMERERLKLEQEIARSLAQFHEQTTGLMRSIRFGEAPPSDRVN